MHIRNNRRERVVIDEFTSQGWEVLTKGWPDLLCYKEGKAILIEVKRIPKRPYRKDGLSKHQRRMIQILKEFGLNVAIRYIA